MNFSWPQIIFVILLVVVPAIKQIMEGLERKKQARAIDQQRNRREMDTLRTGRESPADKPRPTSQYQQSGQVNAADRLREIQAKRREALERARKQAQSGLDAAAGLVAGTQASIAGPIARPGTKPTARPQPSMPRPPVRTPRPTGPTAGPLIGGRAPLPSRMPTQAPAPQPATRPQSRPASQPQRVQRGRSTPRTPPPLSPLHTPTTQRRRTQHASQGDHSTVHRIVQDAEEGVVIHDARAAVSAREIKSMSPIAWRKALVLQELLAPPIALRSEPDSKI